MIHSVYAWLQTHPCLLAFVDWLALRSAGANVDRFAAVWWGGVARRVADACLDIAEQGAVADPRAPAVAAMSAMHSQLGPVADAIALDARLLAPTDDEVALYEGLTKQRALDGVELADRMRRISAAIDSRGDYARAALLRSVEVHLQRLVASR